MDSNYYEEVRTLDNSESLQLKFEFLEFNLVAIEFFEVKRTISFIS